jgi:hypothetical protein
LHPRNVYWFGGMLNIVTSYNKTQTITEMQRLISRSLEPRSASIFIEWATFLVPALVCVAASLHAPSTDSAIRLHTLVFTSLGREWDSEDLTSILSCISGEPVSDGGLGHPMGMQPTRHYLIAIMRKFYKNLVDEYGFVDELFNEQSGHKKQVGEKYALDFTSIQNFPVERLQNFTRLSKFHHVILQSSSPPPQVLRSATASHPASQQAVLNPQPFSDANAREFARLIALALWAIALHGMYESFFNHPILGTNVDCSRSLFSSTV